MVVAALNYKDIKPIQNTLPADIKSDERDLHKIRPEQFSFGIELSNHINISFKDNIFLK